MHGVKRTRRADPAVVAAQQQKEKTKINQIVTVIDQLLELNEKEDYSAQNLDITTKALQLNPELYTAWNFRRQIFLHGVFPNSNPSEIHQLLVNDVNTTTMFLLKFPKVYWIWTHRKWCLGNIPADEDGRWIAEAWTGDLKLVEMMLTKDARNFHAWNYRRHLLSNIPPSLRQTYTPQTELSYTKTKIEANFSNFSAWHQRTKLYGALFSGSEAFKFEGDDISKDVAGDRQEMNSEEKQKILDEEFELVLKAIWTDPADQSAWLYHRWLVLQTSNVNDALTREIRNIKDLLEEEPDSKWALDTAVYFTSRLLPTTADKKEKESMKNECVVWLDKLMTVDSWRMRRYESLKKDIEGM